MEKKYEKLFGLFDSNHCLAFREIIRRLSKTQLNQTVLVGALGDELHGPSEHNHAAAIVLVYHFLYDIEHKALFRLIDCCKTEEDKRKVEKRILSIDVAHFDIDHVKHLASKPITYTSSKLAQKVIEKLDRRAYLSKIEDVLALF